MTRRYMINRRVTGRGDRSDMRDARYWYGTGTELGLHRTPLDCTEIPSISLLSLSKKNEDSGWLLLASDTPVRLVHILSRCILTFIKFISLIELGPRLYSLVFSLDGPA